MPKKLLEAVLPVPQGLGVVIKVRLPFGTKVLQFGFKAQKSAVVTPGPNGENTGVTISPLILCMGDPRATQHQIHRFQMVSGSEDIPDDARYVGVISLPNGASIHLLELGEPAPDSTMVVEEESAPEPLPPVPMAS